MLHTPGVNWHYCFVPMEGCALERWGFMDMSAIDSKTHDMCAMKLCCDAI